MLFAPFFAVIGSAGHFSQSIAGSKTFLLVAAEETSLTLFDLRYTVCVVGMDRGVIRNHKSKIVNYELAKQNRINMCESCELLISIKKRRTDPQPGLENPRPGLALQVRNSETCVRSAGSPASFRLSSVPVAVIPIRWAPKVSWPKNVRSIRPA